MCEDPNCFQVFVLLESLSLIALCIQRTGMQKQVCLPRNQEPPSGFSILYVKSTHGQSAGSDDLHHKATREARREEGPRMCRR